MQEYKKKSTIQAKIFEVGDEDGMSCVPYKSMCENNIDGKYFQCKECNLDIPKLPFISTLENEKHYSKGFGKEYICIGIRGERCLVEKTIFEETYEPV